MIIAKVEAQHTKQPTKKRVS